MNVLQSQNSVRSPSFDIHRIGGDLSEGSAELSATGPSAVREQLQVQWLTDRVNGTVARDPGGFRDAAQLAFGDKADPGSINALIDAARADALPIPRVRFVEPGVLGANVNGAWDGETIYLDRSLMEAPAELEQVFTEEFGHSLDTRLGGVDVAGDEGDIFARTLQGEQLSPGVLASLRAENDHGMIELTGLPGGPRAAEFDRRSDGNGSDASAGQLAQLRPGYSVNDDGSVTVNIEEGPGRHEITVSPETTWSDAFEGAAYGAVGGAVLTPAAPVTGGLVGGAVGLGPNVNIEHEWHAPAWMSWVGNLFTSDPAPAPAPVTTTVYPQTPVRDEHESDGSQGNGTSSDFSSSDGDPDGDYSSPF